MSIGQHVVRTPVIYPVTLCYLSGVLAMVAAVADWIPTGTAIAGFGFVCVLVVLSVMHRDMMVVRRLVDDQHQSLAAQLDHLIDAKIEAKEHHR